MLLPNRHGSNDSYRYGFQGQEKDDEIKGEGNSYDLGARMHDSRVGRWISLDNKSKEFQGNYNFAMNSPIMFIDPDGQDDFYFDKTTNALHVIRNGKPNRYFITEYIYTKPNEKGLSFGHPQNKQHSVSSKEISGLFTNNIPIFRKVLNLYPKDSEQYEEVYNSIDTVDEAAVIAVVLSPLAVIAAVEAVPFLTAEATLFAESGVLQTTIAESFATNTLKTATVNSGIEFISQYASNILINNDFSLGSIDYLDVGLSAAFKGGGSELAQSAFDIGKGGFKVNSLEETVAGLLTGKVSSKLTDKFNNTIGKPLSDFSPSMGSYLQGVGLTGINTVTKSIVASAQKDIQTKKIEKTKDDESKSNK